MSSIPDNLFNWIRRCLERKKRILIIEDNDETSALLSMFLESKGYHPKCAKDGVEGLNLARKIVPDLILLDIAMPKMDGKGTLKAIKSHQATRDIPVVMCTDHSALDDVEECCRMGAHGYILKPFEMKRVLAKVDSVLKPG
jgi:DNA-binding response OmpR family regulator